MAASAMSLVRRCERLRTELKYIGFITHTASRIAPYTCF